MSLINHRCSICEFSFFIITNEWLWLWETTVFSILGWPGWRRFDSLLSVLASLTPGRSETERYAELKFVYGFKLRLLCWDKLIITIMSDFKWEFLELLFDSHSEHERNIIKYALFGMVIVRSVFGISDKSIPFVSFLGWRARLWCLPENGMIRLALLSFHYSQLLFCSSYMQPCMHSNQLFRIKTMQAWSVLDPASNDQYMCWNWNWN